MHQVIALRMRFLKFINYTYIVADRESGLAVVVDPAWELGQVTGQLKQLGVHLAAILLTHSHYDHVNLVTPLVRQYHARVYMSAEEIEAYNFRCPNLTPVHDGEVLNVGGMRITCLLTPGHTAGGMCYLFADSLFTGDTIFIEGCGMCGFDGGCPDRMYESIQRVKRAVGPDVKVYPGHSYGKEPGYPLRYLLQENIYFQLNQQNFVSFRMRPSQPNPFGFR